MISKEKLCLILKESKRNFVKKFVDWYVGISWKHVTNMLEHAWSCLDLWNIYANYLYLWNIWQSFDTLCHVSKWQKVQWLHFSLHERTCHYWYFANYPYHTSMYSWKVFMNMWFKRKLFFTMYVLFSLQTFFAYSLYVLCDWYQAVFIVQYHPFNPKIDLFCENYSSL